MEDDAVAAAAVGDAAEVSWVSAIPLAGMAEG
jgi:hypothetical protein